MKLSFHGGEDWYGHLGLTLHDLVEGDYALEKRAAAIFRHYIL
jgi:hypothetical protein